MVDTPVAEPAIPAGMVPWHGGDKAPSNWDGGPVLLRSGEIYPYSWRPKHELGWEHEPLDDPYGVRDQDIIAYTPKVAEPATAASGGDASEDTARLDWLDRVNANTNEHNGTRYGWRYDINHNRAALTDHNWPPLSIREAIDAARKGGRK